MFITADSNSDVTISGIAFLKNFISATFRIATLVMAFLFLHLYAAADDTTAKVESFKEIFNGKDFSGWVVEGTEKFKDEEQEKPVWTCEDRIIHCAGKGFGFLRFEEKVNDFVLKLDYRLTPKCNSGVGIRGTVFVGTTASRPSRSGYEIQLHDNGATKPTEKDTGSIYLHVAPKSFPAKPAGEWNTITIECVGPKIKITLNDTLIQDYDQKTNSKTAKKPLNGYIALQDHGGKVDFRNVQLKKIEQL